MKEMEHVILHEGQEFRIGVTEIHPNVTNGHFEHLPRTIETDEYTIKKLASYPCAGDTYMHLFQIYNHEDYDLHFYITHNKTYYDKNGFHDKIVYDEKMKSDNVQMAFIEFAIYCEPRSM